MAIKLLSLILENYQLAMKLYGNRLDQDDIAFLDRLTGRDYTYKTMAELLIQNKEFDDRSGWSDKAWADAYTQLKGYDRRVFPIEGFDFDSRRAVVSKHLMDVRAKVIRTVAKWPSIAKRNLRRDIATPRDVREFVALKNAVEYADAHLSYLENRTPEQKEAILRKIFSSDHPTFDDVLDFMEEKENLLKGGKVAADKKDLYKLIEKYNYDLNVVYDKGNIVVIDVTGQPGIKALGCNSLWCFTYGSEYGKAGEQWDHYSHNGHVYAIVDFSVPQDDPSFIHILIKPLEMDSEQETVLYDMANNALSDGNAASIITHIVKDPEVFNVFKWEDF